MALQFSREELDGRVRAARAALVEAGLDAVLIFAQESHYYLTGFDTNGYVFFQCAVLTADGAPITLLTRRPDLLGARLTSTIEDVRVWYDTVDGDPARELRAILEEKGLAGARVGIELNTYGLTAANYLLVARALEGFCTLEDASLLVRRLRAVKSEAELAFVRRAAALADDALDAMVEATGPGAFEGDIAAAMQNAIYRGGGDVPPSGPVLAAGERALLVRNSTGPGHLGQTDQLTLEYCASYRRYVAALMRTVLVGERPARQRSMFDATRDALAAMTEAVRPGRPLGEIDEAHRRVYDAAGFEDCRMAACGYSLGATYRPSWMDVPPMLYAGNPMLAVPGMVLFLHAILADGERNLAMSAGHTVIVAPTGAEVLSRHPVEWIGR
jgi:Xaa-Pro dipeptidase